MKRKFFIFSVILLNFLFFSTASLAVTIAGINIPETYIVERETLALNGVGLRRILGIKIYAGGLYLKKKYSDPEKIINADEPMAIKLLWLRRVPIQKMPKVWTDSFKLATDDNIAPIQDQVNKIIEFTKQEQIKKYVSFNFVYIPKKGTTLYVDTPLRMHKKAGIIEGLEFKKIFFKIWLGNNPCQTSLKQEMLGLK